ncbi:hypothetical protein BC940DRAFT_315194 [Gongronella butleri]|nr:hypothetical protein BC940DRAFT_315194 [Gongronella butleri]
MQAFAKRDQWPGHHEKKTTMLIEQSWKHVLAIARNDMDQIPLRLTTATSPPFAENARDSDALPSPSPPPPPRPRQTAAAQGGADNPSPQHRILVQQHHNDHYDRERLMVQALDTLFALACEGHGYVTFLVTMVSILDPECPVSMAFLSHVIDRATLPSKDTLRRVSPAILAKVTLPHSSSSVCSPSSSSSPIRELKQMRTWHRWPSWNTKKSHSTRHDAQHELEQLEQGHLKRNAVIIWAILAEKFAGDMVYTLWSDEVASFLIQLVARDRDASHIRLYALLAIENFALTGDIKSKILQHPENIHDALKKAMDDCVSADDGMDVVMDDEAAFDADDEGHGLDDDDDDALAPPLSHVSTVLRYFSAQRDRLSMQMGKLSIHKNKSPRWPRTRRDHVRNASVSTSSTDQLPSFLPDNTPPPSRLSLAHMSDLRPISTHRRSVASFPRSPTLLMDDAISSLNLSDYEASQDAMLMAPTPTTPQTQQKHQNVDANVASAVLHARARDTAPRVADLHRMELAHAAQWSLHNVFGTNDDKQHASWDLEGHHVIVNPFDATPHWKLGGNGLEIRNDRPHFESIRATTCVKQGKWYYEVLLVSDGIMQIGWCTSRCRFVPEEGYGVGDDQHGFAFDTYRSAVWANGTAVYPQAQQHQPLFRCRAGDVLGSYLDLEQGICSFFVNGRDVGMTVAFEHASSVHGGQMEGLYPSFSLTTHQHIKINFGRDPWWHPPQLPANEQWHGIHDAANQLSGDLLARIVTWSAQRPYRDVYEPGAAIGTTDMDVDMDVDEDNHALAGLTRVHVHDALPDASRTSSIKAYNAQDLDWDGPLCTMCFTEPKMASLIPCGHGGWGAACAKLLDSW